MIYQIIKSVEKLRELYDGVIWFPGALLTPSVSWLVQPKISFLVKSISGRGVRKAGRGYIDENFSSTPPLKQYRHYKLLQLWT